MKAVCWCGTKDVRVQEVHVPQLENPRDAIVRVTLSAICGSDLHLYDGVIPTMRAGDVLGHEFMGEVVDVGDAVTTLTPGDRVVVPFAIACGGCWYCTQGLTASCDNSNPNAALAELAFGHSPSATFGYTHLYGGYAGGQAEYVRVPFADNGPVVVPDGIDDESALFVGDILPTGWQAAEQCDLRDGDVVAVWGCGPVGQFVIRCALLLGASRVIAIDRYPLRLGLAEQAGERVTALDYRDGSVIEAIHDLTGGRGADACVDAVGLEAHGTALDALYDRAKTALWLATDRIHVLREAIRACRKNGTLSIAGVYGGIADKVPLGAAWNKGLTIRGGPTHVHRYMRPLLARIAAGDLDPTVIITDRVTLAEAPAAYSRFRHRPDECLKVVVRP